MFSERIWKEIHDNAVKEHELRKTRGIEVIRKVFICPLCEGIYADVPVTECDCTVGVTPEFIEGELKYFIKK